jgi:hypothetical protein
MNRLSLSKNRQSRENDMNKVAEAYTPEELDAAIDAAMLGGQK